MDRRGAAMIKFYCYILLVTARPCLLQVIACLESDPASTHSIESVQRILGKKMVPSCSRFFLLKY